MRFVFNFTHDFLLSPDLNIVSKLIAEIRKSENNSHEIWGFFSKEAVYTLFQQSRFLSELLVAADFTPVIHKDHLISLVPKSLGNFAEQPKEKRKIFDRDDFASLFNKQLIATDTCILQF
ncbi:MAG: hypothetical protein ACTSRK_01805 [Promethearchaeota archaeon]